MPSHTKVFLNTIVQWSALRLRRNVFAAIGRVPRAVTLKLIAHLNPSFRKRAALVFIDAEEARAKSLNHDSDRTVRYDIGTMSACPDVPSSNPS